MVKLLPSKQVTRVRFSSPASMNASVAQRIEHPPSKRTVASSILAGGAAFSLGIFKLQTLTRQIKEQRL